MKDNRIKIAFIADKGYLMPTGVAVASLLENRSPDHYYDIYIIVPADQDRDFRVISDAYKTLKRVNVKVLGESLEDLKDLHKGADLTYLSATETSLLKFRLPEILKDEDRVLFLDSDIIIRDDLVDLYNHDLGDKMLAAVRDLPQVLYEAQEIGADINGRDYFNSGVMLLDLAKMREKNISEKLIKKKKQRKNDVLMDQNVFNAVFGSDLVQLDFRNNVCYTNLIYSSGRYDVGMLNDLYGTEYKDITGVWDDAKIIHFSSKLKPWLFYDVPFADEWLSYYLISAFKEERLVRTWHESRDVKTAEVREAIKAFDERVDHGKKTIPIVLASDKKFIPCAAAVARSIMLSGSDDHFYDINILTDESVPLSTRRKMEGMSEGNASVRVWDVSSCFDGIDLYSVGHYSKQMYYRWLIPEIFSYYDKIIYLDSDVIVKKDISRLYETDIGKNIIGAANNFLRLHMEDYVERRLGLKAREYHNSGVLLINNKRFLAEGIKNKCLDFLREEGTLACPDQDVINCVCKGNIYTLDEKWNFQWHHEFYDIVESELIPECKEKYDKLKNGEKYIIHFTSQIKPWIDPEREFAEEFWEVLRDTPFYEEVIYGRIKSMCEKYDNREVLEELRARLNDLDARNEEMRVQNRELKKTADTFRYQLNETRRSVTYKLGRIMTSLPRELRHIVFKTDY